MSAVLYFHWAYCSKMLQAHMNDDHTFSVLGNPKIAALHPLLVIAVSLMGSSGSSCTDCLKKVAERSLASGCR